MQSNESQEVASVFPYSNPTISNERAGFFIANSRSTQTNDKSFRDIVRHKTKWGDFAEASTKFAEQSYEARS